MLNCSAQLQKSFGPARSWGSVSIELAQVIQVDTLQTILYIITDYYYRNYSNLFLWGFFSSILGVIGIPSYVVGQILL